MKATPVNLVLLLLILIGSACNSSTSENKIDSAALALDSSNADTAGRYIWKSQITAYSGDVIHLQKGEWYCSAKYVDYDRERGMLIFEEEDGNIREINSNPWNRTGRMQLTPDRDIRLERGQFYEFIYYYLFEDPAKENTKASGTYLSEIVPRGCYFFNDNRYVDQIAGISFKVPEVAKGRYLDDLEGGVLTVNAVREMPEIYYSPSLNAEKTRLSCETFLASAVKTRFPSTGIETCLAYKDGEWICFDKNGKRRVFRRADQ